MFVNAILHAIIGAILALWGAKIAGLPESSWSLEPFLYILVGFIAGPLSYLVSFNATQGDHKSEGSVIPVLLPSLICFFLGIFVYKWNRWEIRKNSPSHKASAPSVSFQDYYQKLRDDPQIVIRDGWYKMRDQRESAYREALIKNDVPFTPKMLERLTVLDDHGRTLLYQHKNMDSDFLEGELRSAIANHKEGHDSFDKIQAIVKNPQARQSWRILLEESGIKIP